MTPEEIEAKIKELGMTRQDAEAKAKAVGIDLATYLQKATASPGLVPMTTVPVELTPQIQISPPVVEAPKPIKNPGSLIGAGGLKYFGYDIFLTTPAAFEPTAVGPVDPEYLIGPDDVLRITAWGQVEFQNELVVDKEGRIFISTIGQVLVSGLTLQQTYEKLKKQMSRSYSGLHSQPPTVWLDVTLSRLRPKRIFIMGEVDKPGGYTVSSYATVFNSLYSVGGPTTNGSLRDVRVIRGNKIVTRVDLYDYLTGAEETNDIRVQNNDIIFIPPRGKTVAIHGEIRRPAIYELREDEHLTALLKYCGGLLTTVYTEKAQIDRIKPFEERKGDVEQDRMVIDINLSDVMRSPPKEIPLNDADEIQIYSILGEKKNYVSIQGSVWRAGRYELGNIRTLKDLVAAAEGIRPETYMGKVDLERIRPDLTREFVTVNLEKALAGEVGQNIELRPKDVLRLYSIHELEFDKSVSISGHVKNPQTIPFSDSLTLYDLVFKAGGLLDPEFRKHTYLERADLVRLNADMVTMRIIPFDLRRMLEDSTYNVPLQPRDEVVIYGIEVTEVKDNYVTIGGNVKSPGRFPLRSNMTLTDLVLLAGGFTEEAYLLQAEVSRLRPEGLRGDSLAVVLQPKLTTKFDSLLYLRHSDGLSGSNTQVDGEFRLQHRDQVFIRQNPQFTLQKNVVVEGEVKFPGVYTIKRRGERLSEILDRAGGLTKMSYLGGAEFRRVGNRVNLDFIGAYKDRDPVHDVEVLDGDRIVIPPTPHTVRVAGEVNNPGLFSFIDGDDVSDYIDRSGGLTDSAHFAILTKSTGESRRVNFGWLRSDPDVPDGSSITVLRLPPPAPEGKFDLGATIKDTFAIITSAATVAFVVWQVTR